MNRETPGEGHLSSFIKFHLFDVNNELQNSCIFYYSSWYIGNPPMDSSVRNDILSGKLIRCRNIFPEYPMPTRSSTKNFVCRSDNLIVISMSPIKIFCTGNALL